MITSFIVHYVSWYAPRHFGRSCSNMRLPSSQLGGFGRILPRTRFEQATKSWTVGLGCKLKSMPPDQSNDQPDDEFRPAGNFYSFLMANPHVLIPSGFDEIRMGLLSPVADIIRAGFTSEAARNAFRWDALPPDVYKAQ